MNRTFTLRVIAAATLSLTLAACGGEDTITPPPADTQAPNPPAPPATQSFTIELSLDKAVILQGDSLTVKATIQRSAGFAEAVQLALSGLPPGVIAAAASIPAGSNEADIVLSASAGAAHSLPTQVTVKGQATSASAMRTMNVTVRGLPGAVDTSFGGGIVRQAVDIGEDSGNAVAVQVDGKVIVAGASTTLSGTWISLMRFERDGSVDTTFGNGGKVITQVGGLGNDGAAAIALQADGKIVVAGTAAQAATGLDFAVVRYQADGTLDTGFGSGGKVLADFAGDSDRAWALLVQPDGKIVVAGEANTGTASNGVDFALLRLNADGTPDAGFGAQGKALTPLKSNAGSDVVRALALQTVDGEQRILAVGGDGDFLAARYRPDGTVDASFGTQGKVVGLFNASIGSARAVVVLPNGDAVLAGHIDHRFAAVELTSAGALNTGFAAGGRFQTAVVTNWNEATALARQADGKLILGGWAYSGSGSSGDFAAVRLNPDGTIDTSFGSAGTVITATAPGTKNDLAKALVLQQDDRVPAVRAIQAGESNDSNHDFSLLRLWL